MSTTLIFVRHGQSKANEKGIFAGHLDIDLSQLGQQQAELTARYICQNYHVDTIYASDLRRAYHTALPIAQACGKEITKSAQLREIFAGEWEGLPFDELQERYGASYGIWRNDIGNACPTNGESVETLSARIWSAVEEISGKEREKTVVIVSHATPIRTLLCRLKGLERYQMKEVAWVSNCSVTVVSVDDGCWTLEQTGADSHLSELKTQLPANV